MKLAKALRILPLLVFFALVAKGSTPTCAQALLAKSASEVRFENLENKFDSKFVVALDLKKQEGPVSEYKLRLKHETENYTIGHVQFTYDSQKRELGIESMNVMTEFKKSGVGEVLLDQALQKFETDVIAVESLASDNHQVMLEALSSGKKVSEAIQQTPAFKIRQKLGYTKIIPGSINKDYGFKVRKP